MSISSKINIMISSRCLDNFPSNSKDSPLSKIRIALKEKIESETLFSEQIFEVWINEKTPPQGGTWDSWEVCMNAAKDCDILISLYNGCAGWTDENGNIGICHAELSAGFNQASGKVFLIDIADPIMDQPNYVETNQINARFQKYVKSKSFFRGKKVKDINELLEEVEKTLVNAVIKLTQSGVLEASKGKFDSGDALDWSRLNYHSRQEIMTKVIEDVIKSKQGSDFSKDGIFVNIANHQILCVPDAIPDALSVSQAREMVGQPFLNDFKLANLIKKNQGGPVHIIACHKGATETQAKKMLGFPDAIIVNPTFGVYVADNIQKVQFVFIANCRDESTTRHGVQRFFDWLRSSGEDKLFLDRAFARARIIKAIAKENEN